MKNIAATRTNASMSGANGNIAFNGSPVQGLPSTFEVTTAGDLSAYSLRGGAGGAAAASTLIVGNGVLPENADSCVVACGSRLGTSPQEGVHLGRNGFVQGITI